MDFDGSKALYIHPSKLLLHAHYWPVLYYESMGLVLEKHVPHGNMDELQVSHHTARSVTNKKMLKRKKKCFLKSRFYHRVKHLENK